MKYLAFGVKLFTRSFSSAAKYVVKRIDKTCTDMGCSPHWDIDRQSLYFVDLNAARLLRHDYRLNKNYSCKIEGQKFASFIVPIVDCSLHFAVGCGRKVVLVKWDGCSDKCEVEKILFEVQKECKYVGNRLNDGKCDPRGRLFTGTMRYLNKSMESRDGELYKYNGRTGDLNVMKQSVGISSGLAWNEKKNKFYFTDKADFNVKEYDYDMDDGKTCNEKVVYKLQEHIQPDGMTIDKDGNVYVAAYNGSTIYKIKPETGEVLVEIKLPTKQVTSCAFGGPNLDILFATTSSAPDQPDPAGAVFKIIGLRSCGTPMAKLRLADDDS